MDSIKVEIGQSRRTGAPKPKLIYGVDWAYGSDYSVQITAELLPDGSMRVLDFEYGHETPRESHDTPALNPSPLLLNP